MFHGDFHFTPTLLTIATVIDRESWQLIKRQILSPVPVRFISWKNKSLKHVSSLLFLI